MPSPIPLSVVICAKNEEKNIEEALQSVYGWSDEIIVVDDNSTDRTAEVAKKYAKVLTRRMDNEGKHRNWAYSQARNLWVLSLDADEKVSDELKTEIAQAIKDSPHVSYDIPLRNYIGSYWVRHGGWYPASKVRLFRKDKFRYEEVQVHPRCFARGLTAILKGISSIKGILILSILFLLLTGRRLLRRRSGFLREEGLISPICYGEQLTGFPQVCRETGLEGWFLRFYYRLFCLALPVSFIHQIQGDGK